MLHCWKTAQITHETKKEQSLSGDSKIPTEESGQINPVPAAEF